MFLSHLLICGDQSWESEGYDRKDLELPGLTNRLVQEVLSADPNTIIVNQSGKRRHLCLPGLLLHGE
jgi:hypothetical protein